ncbi:type I restriction enzyme HsdR N-terminal domain-containing protein [Halorubrum sp. F4]|uniref:type I restriction endonuclease n=1 Tax=Halorubrum sp. F4 TaxID=2989715 RepID=UPI00247FF75E|nr:type I restriction enzyme HsdR N-terminal domain-containing protein [Halorubrum sp. F4]
MDDDAVAEYVEDARSTIEAAPQMDEANTKAAILQSFLTLLDWKIPENTQLEYSVKAFGRTYKVDYALVLEGTPVAFLEAKGVDTPLNDDHEEQLSSYMSNKNVNYGILTNAEKYRFFQRRVTGSEVSVRRVGTADLEALEDRSTLLEAYTKDDIESGEGREKLERINELREAKGKLETRKDELARELVEVLIEEVSGSIASLAESESKELIDRLVTEIEREIDSGQNERRDPEGTETLRDRYSDRNDSTGTEYLIAFANGDDLIAEFRGDQQAETFVEAVDYLVREHSIVSKIGEFPYIPGRTRPILHEGASTDGIEMVQPREITGGYYVETNLSSVQKRREIDRLVDHYDFTVEFDGDW